MKRATLALHTEAPSGEHLDLFLAIEGMHPLATFETSVNKQDDFFNGKPVSFTRKEDHRRQYLNYEGAISQNRGSVRILWQAQHTLTAEDLAATLHLRLNEDTLTLA